jgi:hypothetical protein
MLVKVLKNTVSGRERRKSDAKVAKESQITAVFRAFRVICAPFAFDLEFGFFFERNR